jgi:hypothetical protein
VLDGDLSDPASVSAPAERYEPIPGLLGLPAHLVRRLSPRVRWVAAAVGGLLLCAAVAGAIVLVPRISETRRDNAAAARRASLLAAQRARARLVAEQRPRHGHVVASASAVTTIEAAITKDTTRRAASGELDNPARRTVCRRLGRGDGRTLLGCTAITSELKSTAEVTGVTVGYSYRAALAERTGRFAFCKTSGHPALGFTSKGLPAVRLPRACGG